MSFFQSIEKLRNKPEQERRVISLTGASIIFSLIFFVWLTTFQLNSEQVGNEEAHNTLSPLDSLKNMSSRFVQDIKKKVGGSEKDDDPLNSISESKTGSAATGVAATYEISDKDTMGTTTKDDPLNNGEEPETFGTSSDMTKSATSSDDVDNTDETVDLIENTAENEEENSPAGVE